MTSSFDRGRDMVRNLVKYESYTRKEVHSIFSRQSIFMPSRGVWGLQGIVPIPDRENDFIFFVSIGRVEGDYAFDEGVTMDGILTWQSQPQQKLSDKKIQSFINHDHNVNSIYLFLRTSPRNPAYAYLGKLAYVGHDSQRENPVHFKWKILDWEITQEKANQIGIVLTKPLETKLKANKNQLIITKPPAQSIKRTGLITSEFKAKHINFENKNKRNHELGYLGELMVMQYEKEYLLENNKSLFSTLVNHTSKTEGDGAGYDIQSFGLDDKIKYIEVKTTTGDIDTPFYLSAREILFSKLHSGNYFLYRIYNYDITNCSGFMYILNGNLEKILKLEPVTFRATVDNSELSPKG